MFHFVMNGIIYQCTYGCVYGSCEKQNNHIYGIKGQY